MNPVTKEIVFLLVQFLLFMSYFIDLDWLKFSLPSYSHYFFYFVLTIGLLTLFFGVLNLKENTWFIINTKSPKKKNDVFLTSGIYNFIRHPIYAGILLIMISYAFLSGSVLKIFITLSLGLVFFFKSILEEKWLINKYRNFRLYKRRTGRFFPKFRLPS